MLVVVIAVMLFAGIWGVSAAMTDVGDETAVNETVEQTTNWTALESDGDRFYSPIVTNQTRSLDEGRDYWFRQETGEIRFNESTEENVTVATTAVDLPGNVGAFAGIIDRMLRVSVFLPLLFVVGGAIYVLSLVRKSSRRGVY